ncbi:MAG: hypothetical protein KTR27_01970 [Leptolyngbyaceae cyanobacterium MAG.088]|nr:hypothetical protein [Leptolyngbyaceae cyanobacterium MAG.088]
MKRTLLSALTVLVASTAMTAVACAVEPTSLNVQSTQLEEGDNIMTAATQTTTQPNEGTSIRIQATPGNEQALTDLLSSAAAIVHDTEPGTLQWVAQRESFDTFRIVDFFADDSGRTAHFAGQVAAALHQQAPELVQSGWEQGVVANVENSQVLASVVRVADTESQPRLASYIELTAKEGQAENLAEFLTGGAKIVEETEPGTVLWYALRIDDNRFAIYDLFVDEAARDAHFGGLVAAALKDSADDLVEGGWEQGVLTNVVHSEVLSITF